MMIDLTEKVIVVTGSSRGIGKALVKAFSEESSKIVINYNNSEDAAENLYNEITQSNKNCIKVKADVTNQDDIKALCNETILKFGKIINIASLKGQEGCEGQTNYSASKAGLIGFTLALAKELGRFNISVNAICPGFIVTDINRHNKEKKKIAEERSLLSINSNLQDLIDFILYASSDKMRGVSGQVFNMDSRV